MMLHLRKIAELWNQNIDRLKNMKNKFFKELLVCNLYHKSLLMGILYNNNNIEYVHLTFHESLILAFSDLSRAC